MEDFNLPAAQTPARVPNHLQGGQKRERMPLDDITHSGFARPAKEMKAPLLNIANWDSAGLFSPEASSHVSRLDCGGYSLGSYYAASPCSASVTPVERLRAAASCLNWEQPLSMLSATGDKLDADGEIFGFYGGHTWHMLARLKEQELLREPVYPYMERQPHINAKMRTILVNWLMEVEMHDATPSGRTVYVAVQILDRYLALADAIIHRKHLQLVGIAAYMIANKCEVHEHLTPAGAAALCDNTFTTEEVIAMEIKILRALNFDVNLPAPVDFLDFFCAASNQQAGSLIDVRMQGKFKSMCYFISEASLLDLCVSTSYAPSAIAAATVLLAQRVTNVSSWNKTLHELSDYTEENLQECMELLYLAANKYSHSEQTILNEKYSSAMFHNVYAVFKAEK